MQGLSAGESPKPGSVPVAEGEVGGQVPFGGALSPSEKGYIFPIPQDKGGEKEGRTKRKWREGRKGEEGNREKGGGGEIQKHRWQPVEGQVDLKTRQRLQCSPDPSRVLFCLLSPPFAVLFLSLDFTLPPLPSLLPSYQDPSFLFCVVFSGESTQVPLDGKKPISPEIRG